MKKQVQPTHAARLVARRSFMKKAAVGAALAVPVIESLTKSDILVKSALAASAPRQFTITTAVNTGAGSGSITPPGPGFQNGSVGVNQGANQTFSIQPAANYVIFRVIVTENGSTNFLPITPAGMTYTFNNVQADGLIAVEFQSKP